MREPSPSIERLLESYPALGAQVERRGFTDEESAFLLESVRAGLQTLTELDEEAASLSGAASWFAHPLLRTGVSRTLQRLDVHDAFAKNARRLDDEIAARDNITSQEFIRNALARARQNQRYIGTFTTDWLRDYLEMSAVERLRLRGKEPTVEARVVRSITHLLAPKPSRFGSHNGQPVTEDVGRGDREEYRDSVSTYKSRRLCMLLGLDPDEIVTSMMTGKTMGEMRMSLNALRSGKEMLAAEDSKFGLRYQLSHVKPTARDVGGEEKVMWYYPARIVFKAEKLT